MTTHTWDTAMTAFTRHLRAAHRSPQTIRTRLSWLRQYAAAHPLHSTPDNITDWMATHPHWKPETCKSVRQTLRAFYSFAYDAGIVDSDPTVKWEPYTIPRTAPRPTPETVYARLLADVTDPRALLALMLAGQAGLRRREIAALRREDLDADGFLWVRGKGGVLRDVPVTGALRDMIEHSPAGWLFPGRWTGHIHPDALSKLIRRATGGSTSAHPLRHRYASVSYSADHDIAAVKELLGHSSLETTQRYVAVNRAAKIRAAQAAA